MKIATIRGSSYKTFLKQYELTYVICICWIDNVVIKISELLSKKIDVASLS